MFPETGSFLEEIFTELKSMYEFSTGGGNSGNSFSELFVNYFNNDKNNPVLFDIADCPPLIQKFIEKAVADISSSSTLNIGSWAWIGIDMNLGSYNYFGTNNKMNQSSSSKIVIHELVHGVLRINNLKIGQNSWL